MKKRTLNFELLKAWAKKTKYCPRAELETRTGISYSTACKVIKGECPVNFSTQKKIADGIGIGLDDLFPEVDVDIAS